MGARARGRARSQGRQGGHWPSAGVRPTCAPRAVLDLRRTPPAHGRPVAGPRTEIGKVVRTPGGKPPGWALERRVTHRLSGRAFQNDGQDARAVETPKRRSRAGFASSCSASTSAGFSTCKRCRSAVGVTPTLRSPQAGVGAHGQRVLGCTPMRRSLVLFALLIAGCQLELRVEGAGRLVCRHCGGRREHGGRVGARRRAAREQEGEQDERPAHRCAT